MTTTGNEAGITKHYQNYYLHKLKHQYNRGLISDETFAEAISNATRPSNDKPSRPGELEPPLGAQAVRIPMDRVTELAVDYLQQQEPHDLNLDCLVSKAELFRIAICRWAIEAGWQPILTTEA